MSSDYVELFRLEDRKPKTPLSQKLIYLIGLVGLVVIFATR